jgi:predicted N-acetyltransferase YhbS
MQFLHIQHGSDHYKQAKQLRAAVLRIPLRRVLTQADVAGEELQLHFVAVLNNLVVGTVTMKPLADAEAQLRQMAISPLLQGRGVGKKLVAFAEAALKERGFQTIRTDARVSAEKFYARLGFTAGGDTFTIHALPHVHMTKVLGTRH